MIQRTGRSCALAALAAILVVPALAVAQPTPAAPVPAAPVPAAPVPAAPVPVAPSAPPVPGAAPGVAPYPYQPYPYPYPYQPYPYPYPYPYYGPYYGPPPRYYPTTPLPPPVPKEPYSKRMTYAGISMVSLGGIGVVVGAIIAVEGSRRTQIYGKGGYVIEKRPEDGMQNGGIALAVISGLVTAAGIPVWAYGAHKVPIKQPSTEPSQPTRAVPNAGATLRVGAGSASLEVAF